MYRRMINQWSLKLYGAIGVMLFSVIATLALLHYLKALNEEALRNLLTVAIMGMLFVYAQGRHSGTTEQRGFMAGIEQKAAEWSQPPVVEVLHTPQPPNYMALPMTQEGLTDGQS